MTDITLRPACDKDLHRLRAWGKRVTIWQLPEDHRQGLQPEVLTKAIENIYSHMVLRQSITFIAEQKSALCGVAIATQRPNPIDCQPSGLLHTFIVPKRWLDGETCFRMLSAIEEGARDAGWRIIHANVGYFDTAATELFNSTSGWELGWLNVRKRLGLEMPHPLRDATVKIRRARSEDLPFVQELWTQAVINGLDDYEHNLYSFHQIQAAAVKELDAILHSDAVVLIAEDGVRIGHGVACLSIPQEFTGRIEAVLWDSFVLPEYRNKGIATALTAGVEAIAVLACRNYINGSVRGNKPAHTEQILINLVPMGWKPFQRCFRKVLN